MIKDKKHSQIWEDCEVSVTLLHYIFQIFEAEDCPDKDIIHSPSALKETRRLFGRYC